MSTQKFQLRYSPVEDRILIIVTDQAGQDEVFGLTRRLVKRLVPGLEKVLRRAGHLVQPQPPESHSTTPAPTPAETAAFAARQKEQEAAAGRRGDPVAETGAGAADPPAPPAPAPSHLVTRLRVIDRGKGQHVLQITDGIKALNIPLTDEQLAQFSHGIVTVLDNADWDLTMLVGADDAEGEPASPGTALDITAESPSKYRH